MFYTNFTLYKGLSILLFSMLTQSGMAQLNIVWDAGLGGNNYEGLTTAKEYFDGGFILGGSTSSSVGGDIKDAPRGMGDFLVARTYADGSLQWVHSYGGDQTERVTSLAVTSDGAIVCVGESASGVGFDKASPNEGGKDAWVVKLNDKGDMLWEKSFGGTANESPYAVVVDPFGNIYVGGYSNSPISGSKTAPNLGGNDYWLIKLSPDGNMIWDKTYGGPGDERLYYGGLTFAQDGNLVIAGSSDSGVGPMKTEGNFGGMDYWIIKVDTNGDIIWDRTIGGVEEDQTQDIISSQDGGFVIGGGTRSPMGGNKTSPFYGLIDYFLVKLDANGNLEWEKTYGGSGLEVISGLAENEAGNILIGGLSDSGIEGSKTEASIGLYDYWLIYLNSDGSEVWQDVYGAAQRDVMTVLFRTSDGGYFVGGDSESGIGEDKTTQNFGFNDCWYFKLACDWRYESDYDFVGCDDEQIMLDLTSTDCENCTFVWPDKSKGNVYDYGEDAPFQDKFMVSATNEYGCTVDVPVSVEYHKAPNFSLGNDTIVYEDSDYILSPNPMWVTGSLLWSTGDTALTIAISEPGIYSLTINDAGCVSYDEVLVGFEGHRKLYIPNAFSPNDDGVNDIFKVYGDEAIQNIKSMSIFDRWGNQIYLQEDFIPTVNAKGWGGTFRGRVLESGVYLYAIVVEFTDGTTEIITGDVSLFR